jgi:chemotaxis protein histidine kinase CheA
VMAIRMVEIGETFKLFRRPVREMEAPRKQYSRSNVFLL